MTGADLKVVVEQRAGLCLIRVSGAADHVQYYKIEEAIQTQLDRKQLVMIVDLSELTYISSAGINTLGHAAAQFEKVKGRLCYVRPAKTAQWHFFTTVGVDTVFPWAESLEAAIAKVTAP